MSRNNSNRAGGMYEEWKRIGYKPNPANERERAIEYMYTRLLTDLAINRFKWTGLPEEISVRYLEETLFYFGLSIFYHDGRFDKYMALRGNSNGWLDYQNNPTAFNVVGNNFPAITVSAVKGSKAPINRQAYVDNEMLNNLDWKDYEGELADMGQAVPIWANYARRTDIDVVLIYAKRLANFDRTVEINSNNARQPKVLVTDENTNLSVSNLNRQIDEGQGHVKIRESLTGTILALDLGINPDTIEKIDIVSDRHWNKCMRMLGIENSNQDKKERLVSDEVTANADITSSMRNRNLNARRDAAKAINKIYPSLNVSVEYYTDEERRALMDVEDPGNQGDKKAIDDDTKGADE